MRVAPVPEVEDEPSATMVSGPPAKMRAATCGIGRSSVGASSETAHWSTAALALRPAGATSNAATVASPTSPSATAAARLRRGEAGGFSLMSFRREIDRLRQILAETAIDLLGQTEPLVLRNIDKIKHVVVAPVFHDLESAEDGDIVKVRGVAQRFKIGLEIDHRPGTRVI